MTTIKQAPPFDIVVFGATSFVGQILCHHFHEKYGANGRIRWALAGRSLSKLEGLRKSLGASALKTELLVVDATDEQALRKMCLATKVVVSTVGPYALYGEPLVKVCAETGTDYCDLTGEVQWIRRMIERYGAAARASGARIVHSCGFDSIPSDLGVWFLQRESRSANARACSQVKLRVRKMRGGISGGTIASIFNVIDETKSNPDLRRELANHYSLCVEFSNQGVKQPADATIAFDNDFNQWIAPFLMSGINTRIVHRSNALLNHAYGVDFVYSESVLTGPGWAGKIRAFALGIGLGAFVLVSSISPLKAFLRRFVLPKPGEGPSPEEQEKGFYDLRLFGRTPNGRPVKVKILGDRDPGYGSTAKLLTEAAMCLAFDLPKDACVGGVLTPAAAMAEQLIPRLQANAGLKFLIE